MPPPFYSSFFECNKWSDYIKHHESPVTFSSKENWVILSSIESEIKRKIELRGVPLSQWNIKINYGIKTGYNPAFIIDGKTKANLIQEDPKSAEIIRPILRGRDIKRYGFDYNNLWLIATFPSLHLNIDRYPAIKSYLLSFGMQRLEQTGKIYIINGEKIKARKKTNNKWFETQDQIAYRDDFSKPKIVYREISLEMVACFVEKECFVNNKCYIVTGENLYFLLGFLNSKIFQKTYLKQANQTGGRGNVFLKTLCLPKPKIEEEEYLKTLVLQAQSKECFDSERIKSISKIDHFFEEYFGLTPAEIESLE